MQLSRHPLAAPVLRPPFGEAEVPTLTRKALAILRRYGTNAHVYLPGSTVTTYGGELWGAPTTFSNGTVTADGLDVVFTASSINVSGGKAATGMTGKTFSVTYTLSGMDGGDQARIILYGNGTVANGATRTANGTYTEELTPSTAGGSFTDQIRCQTVSGGTLRFSAISVREKITTSTPISGLLTNNYTLSDGSTGYSSVDGTAGLVLDAAGSVGAELALPTTSTAGWSTLGAGAGIVSDGTSITLSTASANNVYAGFSGITVGATYQCTVIVDAVTSCLGAVAAGAGSFVMNGVGTYSFFVTCTAAGNTLFSVSTNSGAAASIKFRAMSIKQVTGIHASQSTTANKPALRRGLLNVLKQSNTFTDANWAKTNITPTAGVADPFGGTAATTLTATGVGEIYQTAADAGKPYTSGIYIRRRTGSGAVSIRNAANTAWIPLSLTSAWQLFVNDGGTTTANWYLDLQISTSGDAVDVYGAIVSPGVLSAQQIISEGLTLTTSTAASNSAAGRYWHQYTAANSQHMNLASVPFQMSDDHCVIAGFTPNAGGVFAVGITNAGGTTMCGNLRLASDGVLSAWWKDDVAAQSLIYGSGSVIGVTLVASARKVGNVKSLRSNGTQVATDSTVLGTTTLTNANIGSLTSVDGFMNGTIGPVILIKGTVSDADLLTLERWVASQTPAGPVF